MKKILLTTVILGMSATASQAFFWSSDNDQNKKGQNRLSVEKVFEKYDIDTDDKLSIEEFLTHRKDVAEKRMNKNKSKKKKMNKEPEDVFERMENIMKKQILLGALIVSTIGLTACSSNREMRDDRRMRNVPSVQKVFEIDDLNKDGKLSEAEFMKHKEKRSKRRNKRGRMTKITPKEMFQMMDSDKNGFVTQEEMKAHREARKEQRMERRKNRKGMNK